MSEHFETETEKKISKVFNKYCKMLDFSTNEETLDLFEFERIFNILTNLNSVAVDITEIIDEGYRDFARGELLLVKDLINLLFLYFHLTNQITIVASYIDNNFNENGEPLTER